MGARKNKRLRASPERPPRLAKSAPGPDNQSAERAKRAKPLDNRYTGTRLGPRPRVEEVASTSRDLEPESFWAKYISKRRPVVIHGGIPDLECKAPALWTDSYLKKHAGKCKVLAERRLRGPGPAFGRGERACMLFADVVDAAAAGDDSVYMTAQHPEGDLLVAPPLRGKLAADLPRAPRLAERLELQSVNMWMGASADGASSGLHHDFHDNVYLVFRGRKRFRLFSPDMAGRMATHGRITRVRPNGVMDYARDEQGRQDSEDKGDSQRVSGSEEDGDDDDDEDEDDGPPLFGEAEGEGADGAEEDSGFGNLHFSDDHDDFDELFGAERQDTDTEGAGPTSSPAHQADEARDRDAASPADARRKRDKRGEPTRPRSLVARRYSVGARVVDRRDADHFSAVDLTQPWAEVRARHPSFPAQAECAEVVVEAGDALYLPAGWFHEVTSFNGAQTQRQPGRAGHLAVNWWFHPPGDDGAHGDD